MKPLYKTTIIIWTECNPEDMELTDLADDVENGDSHISQQLSVFVDNPADDAAWDGTDFFDDEENADAEEDEDEDEDDGEEDDEDEDEDDGEEDDEDDEDDDEAKEEEEVKN